MIAPSRPPRSAPGLAAILCLIAAAAQALPAGAASPAAAPPPKAGAAKASALLLRGPVPDRGLPFFGPNAIPVLRCEYLLGAAAGDAASAVGAAEGAASTGAAAPGSAAVWYTREAVVLSSGWKAIPGSANAALRVLKAPGGEVLYVKGEGYSLFVQAREADAAARAFGLALNRRFAVFFNGAASDAELSFPAIIEY